MHLSLGVYQGGLFARGLLSGAFVLGGLFSGGFLSAVLTGYRFQAATTAAVADKKSAVFHNMQNETNSESENLNQKLQRVPQNTIGHGVLIWKRSKRTT